MSPISTRIYTGGAVSTCNTILNFSGTNNFINNRPGCSHGGDHSAGGAIIIFGNTVLSFTGSNNFINNSVGHGGGAMFTTSVEPATSSTTQQLLVVPSMPILTVH